MTMGLSMALYEASILNPHLVVYINYDFAEYHTATNADVGEVDVAWIEEDDPYISPMGAKGESARSASSARPPPSQMPYIMPPALISQFGLTGGDDFGRVGATGGAEVGRNPFSE